MRSLINSLVLYILVVLAFLWIMLPFYWLAVISLENLGDLASKPPKFIPSPTVDNYVTVLTGRKTAYSSGTFHEVLGVSSIVPPLLNSSVIALMVAGLTVALACPAGFAYSRFSLPLRRFSFSILLGVRVLPLILTVIPFFTIFSLLSLINTHIGLILAHLTLTVPFATWIFMSYIDTVPKSLEEAAMVDGASYFQAFLRVVLRIALPGILSIALFAFLTSWGEFLFAVTLANQLTFPPVLLTYISLQVRLYNEFSAAAVLALIPPVVLTAIFQKYLVRGLTGALKG